MNKKYLAGGALVVIIAAVAAVWFLFFKDDAPDAVSSDAANADLDAVLSEDDVLPDETLPDGTLPDDTATDDPASDDPAPEDAASAPDGIDGAWVVDDEIGEFDFDTASGSFAGFRVAEELTVGETTAVGRSGDVSGTVTIVDGTLTGAEIVVDMTTIVSDRSQREGAIRRAIDATEFPEATFTFDGGVDVSSVAVGGDVQTFEIEGDLTVAGVTNPVTFTIDANVRDDGFAVIVGSTEIVWEDFGVTPPSAPIVVSIADGGTVEFQLVVAR